MKRIGFFCLALLLCLSLFSCGRKEADELPEIIGTLAPEDVSGEVPDTVDYAALTRSAFAGWGSVPESDFQFTVSEGSATLTGYTGSAAKVTVPASLGGLPVVRLAASAFSGNADLVGLSLPDSIVGMEFGSLSGCSSLYALRLPILPVNATSGKVYLGSLFGALEPADNPIAVPSSLEFLSLGEQLTALPAYSLFDCNDLVGIDFPAALKSVEKYALSRCASLKWCDLSSVESLGDRALAEDSALLSLSLNSLQTVGSEVLEGCGSLSSLALPFLGDGASHAYLGYLFGASLPDFTAGYLPRSLKEVTLLAGCAAVGDYGFFECSSLRRVNLPEGMVSIGIRAFDSCICLTELTLPDSLLSIGENAFFSCRRLRSVVFGSGLSSLGINAFYRCTALESLVLPASLTSLPASVFADCVSLGSVDLGGVSSVG